MSFDSQYLLKVGGSLVFGAYIGLRALRPDVVPPLLPFLRKLNRGVAWGLLRDAGKVTSTPTLLILIHMLLGVMRDDRI